MSNNFEREKASLVWAYGASSGVVRTACDIQIDGRGGGGGGGGGRPKRTWKIVCLFDFILYVPSTIFQLCRDESSRVEPVLS